MNTEIEKIVEETATEISRMIPHSFGFFKEDFVGAIRRCVDRAIEFELFDKHQNLCDGNDRCNGTRRE